MPTKQEHTPGPWIAIADMVIVRGNKIDREICRCTPDRSPEENDANAELIASTPDLKADNERLRAALSDLMWRFDDDGSDPHDKRETAPDILAARVILGKVKQ